ncbi:MAG: PIG-L family deacetylase [bacterium]|nr:PIG-L family deacetylase [bacterium]
MLQGLALLLIICLFLLAAVTAYQSWHRQRLIYLAQRIYLKLSNLPNFSNSDRILIIAPHSDDEGLCCTGIIHRAVSTGCPVKIVVITNGDGFRYGVDYNYHKPLPKQSDYIKFGCQRQAETRTAMVRLGVKEQNIIFLGYPDRGIASLWQRNWDYGNPYLSPYTRTSRSPYKDSYTSRAVYCGQSLLKDLSSIMHDYRPTRIFTSHPGDQHPDHWATCCFTLSAIENEGLERPYFKAPLLYSYLTHWHRWPDPRMIALSLPLAPPWQLADLGYIWHRMDISSGVVQIKLRIIDTYKSQVNMFRTYMGSFARKNELFCLYLARVVPLVDVDHIKIDGQVNDWLFSEPLILDTVNDSLWRDIEGSGDVVSVTALRDEKHLYLLLRMRKQISTQIDYRINMMPLPTHPSGLIGVSIHPGKPAEISNSGTPSETGIKYAWDNNYLEMKVPLQMIGGPSVMLDCETFRGRFIVDRSAYRDLYLTD